MGDEDDMCWYFLFLFYRFKLSWAICAVLRQRGRDEGRRRLGSVAVPEHVIREAFGSSYCIGAVN